MFKGNYCYKYLKLNYRSLDIIIELSVDNSFGKSVFSAKTNFMFKDEFGDWGHAVGVGQNENEALAICFEELNGYLHSKVSKELKEVKLPQKIVFDFENKAVVLYLNKCAGGYLILTTNGTEYVKSDDICETISLNPHKFVNYSILEYNEKLFRNNKFNEPFDVLTVRCPHIDEKKD